jgi:hypothetical protein
MFADLWFEKKVNIQPPLQMLLVFWKGAVGAAPRALSGRPAAAGRVAEQLQKKTALL